MPKITIIGAGAYVFPLGMTRDILSFPALQDSTICLFDVDATRNRRTAAGVRKLVELFKLPTRVQVTTDRKRALLTLPQIRQMVDEMLAAESRWLPQFTPKTLLVAGTEEIRRRVTASLSGA